MPRASPRATQLRSDGNGDFLSPLAFHGFASPTGGGVIPWLVLDKDQQILRWGLVRHDISVNQDYRNRYPKLKKSESSWLTFAIPVLYSPFLPSCFRGREVGIISSKSTMPGTGKQCTSKLSERTRQRANNKPERCPAHRRRYDPQPNYHLATNAITAISLCTVQTIENSSSTSYAAREAGPA